MPERAILREHFEHMRRAAEDAAGRYESLAATTTDAGAKDKLKRLAMDTSRHVALTERLLEIVSE